MNVTLSGCGGEPRPPAHASSAVGRPSPARIKQVATTRRNLALVSIDLMFCLFMISFLLLFWPSLAPRCEKPFRVITEVQPEFWAEVTRKSGGRRNLAKKAATGGGTGNCRASVSDANFLNDWRFAETPYKRCSTDCLRLFAAPVCSFQAGR